MSRIAVVAGARADVGRATATVFAHYRSHPYRGFCQLMMSSGFIDIAISQAQKTYATAELDCFACLKNSSV